MLLDSCIFLPHNFSTHSSHQSGLGLFFLDQGFQDAFVNRILGDEMLNDNRFGLLPLPPQSGVGLLVEFQTPCQPKPHQHISACLQIQAMPGSGWVQQTNLQPSGIPVPDTVGGLDFLIGNIQFSQSLLNPLQIMLEPVCHQNGLAVGGFY